LTRDVSMSLSLAFHAPSDRQQAAKLSGGTRRGLWAGPSLLFHLQGTLHHYDGFVEPLLPDQQVDIPKQRFGTGWTQRKCLPKHKVRFLRHSFFCCVIGGVLSVPIVKPANRGTQFGKVLLRKAALNIGG